MTGFFIDLTAPRERALICSDTLSYTVAGEHVPLGFCTKVIAFPHLRGALIGAGLYDIQVRAAAELLLSPEITGFEEVLDALPHILDRATAAVARERGIENPDALMLFAAGWVGLDHASGKFALVLFENHKGYAPQRGAAGLIGIPNVPASYIPPGFDKITSPEVRAMAGLRAIGRFTQDHGALLGMPPIGGEILLTEVNPAGVSSRVVGRFDDFAATRDEAAAVQAELVAGERLHLGADLAHHAADIPARMEEVAEMARAGLLVPAMPASAAPGLSRQQRRAAARKAGMRAA